MREVEVLDSIEKLKRLTNHTAPIGNTHETFFGRGKLLLSGEYFILEGAKGLALPTKVGQRMSVQYSQSFNPQLHWKSFDIYGNLWFECKFEFWQFNFIDVEEPSPEQVFLQKILRAVRKQNHHFLRDDVDVIVETNIDFPFEWGLGSSSTLIYNIAQWAYVSPFELHFRTTNGSGYDIACAQSEQPILYSNDKDGPSYSTVNFDPSFKQQLCLIHLNQKAKSFECINSISSKRPFKGQDIAKINQLTSDLLSMESLDSFNNWILQHETCVGEMLGERPVKQRLFADYPGQVKSLGAWGGDFVLATYSGSFEEAKEYFLSKDHNVIMPYDELCLTSSKNDVLQ